MTRKITPKQFLQIGWCASQNIFCDTHHSKGAPAIAGFPESRSYRREHSAIGLFAYRCLAGIVQIYGLALGRMRHVKELIGITNVSAQRKIRRSPVNVSKEKRVGLQRLRKIFPVVQCPWSRILTRLKYRLQRGWEVETLQACQQIKLKRLCDPASQFSEIVPDRRSELAHDNRLRFVSKTT
jgi:hypothetical protein